MPSASFHYRHIPWPRPAALAASVMAQAPRLWLDSALDSHELGRYSILSAAPRAELTLLASGQGQLQQGSGRITIERPLEFLETWLQRFELQALALPKDFPPTFCGGALGLFSYESFGLWLRQKARLQLEHLPPAYFLLCDTALVLDHRQKRATIFSWGIKEDLLASDAKLAAARVEAFAAELQALAHIDDAEKKPFSLKSMATLETRESYGRKIEAILEAIHRGDCYQVNLAQKLIFHGTGDAAALYLKWREQSPAPQMAFMNLGELQILSASPEILLEAAQGHVRSFPIKGTRPRGQNPAEDEALRAELLQSPKEAAELLMIVDLIRNDLGKCCAYGSVTVPDLRRMETYPHLHHVVAQVSGRRRAGLSNLRVLLELLPGGSITGAPKLKAMDYIDALEASPRGIYTGSLGYFSFNDLAMWNLAIRSALKFPDRLEYHVGSGIVADSTAEAEYEECFTKAAGILKVLGIKI